MYDEPFWAPTAWLNRLPTPAACWQNRWQEVFNVAKYIPQLPMLVAFTAGDPAWEAEQDTDEVLIQQVIVGDMCVYVYVCIIWHPHEQLLRPAHTSTEA